MGERTVTVYSVGEALSLRLADIRPEHLKAMAEGIRKRARHCPWNPFPADSPWGRKIEEAYARQQAGRLALQEDRNG
ncbi:hypothetical protein [Enterovirga aerilata]|uniref:Uncharacterized protein n=1 Tax=Enterovirga aerilata TaxID=2730920 RepID=A0A849IC75_9HYPH|nr:hypothetical protein [Enterovirga sp. DB1703]NNM75008.1 hypothetical protein [Enterovirga sp. DB1703]